ncbi:11076_t:CDS:2 [Paraglomus occultum]|uniref:11076_t:CDS:1 n=1 Tax=Paraglomus occultum TaxID=144539 RepID=A0A9N9BZR7_9GLOM|nr:11076_t:CDS:2 [Paraglomus occultum]
MFIHYDPNLCSYLVHPHQIINNGEDFIYYCGTPNTCHIGNALYFIVYSHQQSLHYFTGCDNGSHMVLYVKNEEELSYIPTCNMNPNHEDFYIYDYNGCFSYVPSQFFYFVYHFSSGYDNDDDNSNSSYQGLPSRAIDDTGSSIEPIENNETNTTVLSNNPATHTQHSSKNGKGELYIIDGVIRAVYKNCTVDLEINDVRNIIKKLQKRKKNNSVNSFILYRVLLSKKLEYKRKEFAKGDFQSYISEFAGKTWKGKTASAEKAVKDLAVVVNEHIKSKNLNPTLGV